MALADPLPRDADPLSPGDDPRQCEQDGMEKRSSFGRSIADETAVRSITHSPVRGSSGPLLRHDQTIEPLLAQFAA